MTTLTLTSRLCAAFLLLAAPAWAAAPHQAESIFAVAYGQYGSAHGGMAWPQSRPEVRLLAQADLCAAAHYPEHCAIKGYYRDGLILLVNTLDFSNVEDTTILLHEYVHYLQELRLGGPAKTCQDNLDREMEAYRLQAAVLFKVDRPMKANEVLFQARQLRCANAKE